MQDWQSLEGPLRDGPARNTVAGGVLRAGVGANRPTHDPRRPAITERGGDMDGKKKRDKLGWIVAQYREHNVAEHERMTSAAAKVAVALLIGSLRCEWARAERQDRNG